MSFYHALSPSKLFVPSPNAPVITLSHTTIIIFLFLVGWDWVHLVLPIVPAPDDSDCGATDGMKIGRGNRSTRRKPAPVSFCPPEIPHDLTRARTRATAVGSQRLTAWAMARLLSHTILTSKFMLKTNGELKFWVPQYGMCCLLYGRRTYRAEHVIKAALC
jgi:hypothetical protein